jgi:hypothetical protein
MGDHKDEHVALREAAAAVPILTVFLVLTALYLTSGN